MYSIETHGNSGITPVRTGRTRVTTCIFIKLTLFGTLTGTTDVVQVVPGKFNKFSVHILDTPALSSYSKSSQSSLCSVLNPTGTK